MHIWGRWIFDLRVRFGREMEVGKDLNLKVDLGRRLRLAGCYAIFN